MTADDREQRASEFMHALAASEADVANISAERTSDDIRVTLNLLDEGDWELVREIASEHGFEQRGDAISRMVFFEKSEEE